MPKFDFNFKSLPQILFLLVVALFGGGAGAFGIYYNISGNFLQEGSTIDIEIRPIENPADTTKLNTMVLGTPVEGPVRAKIIYVDNSKKGEEVQ